jgi:hypothetical protein
MAAVHNPAYEFLNKELHCFALNNTEVINSIKNP